MATTHPDVGGDSEDFKRLRDAYERLLREATHGSQSSGGGEGFCGGTHAQWSADASNKRRYREGEAPSYTSRHGEGLGYEFSKNSGWDSTNGRWVNRSTASFYRPYHSDFEQPYGHGYSDEELKEADRARQWKFKIMVVKYAAMAGGLALVCYMHATNNRVERAVRARDGGYRDPTYWEAVDNEKAQYPLLRLEKHWLDPPLPEKPKTFNEEERPAAPQPRPHSKRSKVRKGSPVTLVAALVDEGGHLRTAGCDENRSAEMDDDIDD